MIDRLIGISGGLTLLFGSVSGLKCINSCSRSSGGCEPDSGPSNKTCSKANMNLGLASMGVTGALMVYKHIKQ